MSITFSEASSIISKMHTRARGLLSKMCKDSNRYKPKTEIDIKLVNFVNNVFQPELELSERIFLLARGMLNPPKCDICENKAKFDSGKFFNYRKYCSIECREKQRKLTPNCAKQFKIDGEVYSSIKDAERNTGYSRHLIISKCLSSDYPNFEFHPDHQKGIRDELELVYSKCDLLRDTETLICMKKEGKTISYIANHFGVHTNDIRDVFVANNIDTTYDQLSEETRKILSNKSLMEELIVKYGSAEGLAKNIGCSASTASKTMKEYGIEYVVESSAEIEICEAILAVAPDINIVKRDRTILYGREIDVYLPDNKFGIEHHGVYWHGSYDADYHKSKYEIARKRGVRLLQIFEDDWDHRREMMIDKIFNGLNIERYSIVPSECTININGNVVFVEYYGNCVAYMKFSESKIIEYHHKSNKFNFFNEMIAKYVELTNVKSLTFDLDLMWYDEEDNIFSENGFVAVEYVPPQSHPTLKSEVHLFDVSPERHFVKDCMCYDVGHFKLIKEIL